MLNSTNYSTGQYLFTPNYKNYYGILVFTPLVFGIIGLTGNTIILYIIRKHLYSKKKNFIARRTFGRPYLFKYFIQSLALSDVMGSVATCVILVLQSFFDVRQNIWVCRIVRFPFFAFPFITINNLIVISLERYYAVFHPLRVPSPSIIRMAVILAWIGGTIFAFFFTNMIEITRYELSNNNWSLACSFDSGKTSWQRSLFLIVSLLQYYIPNIILLYITFSISRFLHKRLTDIHVGKLHFVGSSATWRFKGTKMFVRVILAFSLPYVGFFGYNLIKSVFHFRPDYHHDYLMRYVSGFLALFNSSINPFIYSINSLFFRTELRKMSQRTFSSSRKKKFHKRTEVYVINNKSNSELGSPTLI